MTRVQFLNNLYHRLGGLTQEQAEQHLTYYAEMLADRMEEGMTEEEAVAGMEDVDTIARRILEEEGLPYEPPVTPPAYPDLPKAPGGGGTKGYQPPKKRNYRKIASILLWLLAAVCVLGALKRFTGRHGAVQEAAPEPNWEAVDVVEGLLPLDVGSSMPDGLNFYQDWPLQAKYDFPADEVEEIEINWTSGVVDIQSGDTYFALLERSSGERPRMSYTLDGKVLIIQANGAAGLTVYVPRGFLERLEINTVSAAVRVQDADMDTLSVRTTSGSVALESLYADSLEVGTISGDVLLGGLYVDELEISTTSGDITGGFFAADIDLSTISGDTILDATGAEEIQGRSTSGCFLLSLLDPAEEISLETKSGDIRLRLPEEPGFQLSFDTISGDIEGMDFPSTHVDGVYTYGDGFCEIEVSTTSGDLYLIPQ